MDSVFGHKAPRHFFGRLGISVDDQPPSEPNRQVIFHGMEEAEKGFVCRTTKRHADNNEEGRQAPAHLG